MPRQERRRTNSATSYHSLRFASDPSVPTLASQGASPRNPTQVPLRPRNGSVRYDRENISPGSYGSAQSPQLSPPNPPAPIMHLGNHRQELSVLQTPQFVLRQNPPSAAPSPNGTAATAPGGFHLNSNIFGTSQEQSQLSPHRPGTAPSTGTQTQGQGDSYFPDEPRRPSVASVATNASSAGSKSSVSRSIYKKFFGEGETTTESPGSSESSIPPNATPRSHYNFPRPSTPTGPSRPRTPLPSAEVVPFLYQDPDDIRRLGDAPVHDVPILGERDDASATSSHNHRGPRILQRSRHRDREKSVDKELPRPPISSSDPFFQDYRKGLKLHLDGTASSHSSQTRLLRSASPTPSIASSLSNNPPRSPGEIPSKTSKGSFFAKFGDFAKIGEFVKKSERDRYGDVGKDNSGSHGGMRRLKQKASEPMLKSNGVPPLMNKRGSGSNEYANTRTYDHAPAEQLAPGKSSGKVPEAKSKIKEGKTRSKGTPRPHKETNTFAIDTDFTNIDEIVKQRDINPGPNSSWLADDPPPLLDRTTWEPPESWRLEPAPVVDDRPDGPEDDSVAEDAQYCIRVFRADSTFATLSCKLQASVTEVIGLIGRKSFLQDDLSHYQIVMKKNGLLRILGPHERPLKIQKRLLEQAGYTEDDHLDEIGREDHGYLVRFTFMMARTGGYSLGQDPGLSRVQKYSHVELQGRNLLTIPITLYHKAPEIISLNLSRNLSLNIPKDFIQQCVNLRKIEFTGNDCERLPPSMSAASRLTYLDISHNRLEELDSASLGEHAALVALKISNNRLRSLPASFGRFKSLRSLQISSNCLEAFPQFICELVTLVDLDISFNNIRSFPLEIGQLAALERLNATNNRLRGALPQTFAMLTSLKELDLRFNYDLQNIDVISELPRLETVVVSHNRISGLQHSFHTLRALQLNSNPVTRFSIPTPIPTLTLLNLSNAKLAAISETLFERLPSLQQLILDKNHLVAIPSQISKLRKLEYLSCYQNELAKLPNEIGLLQELKTLDLHSNFLKFLPVEIWQLPNLHTLNVSSNALIEFPKPPTAPSYAELSGSAAREKPLPVPEHSGEEDEPNRRPSQHSGGLLSAGIPTTSSRKGSMASSYNYANSGRNGSIVSRSGSDVGAKTPTLGSRKDSSSSYRMSSMLMHSLTYLYLGDNHLKDEVFEELSLLSELKVLNLSYNDLYDIPSRALSRMPQLHELYLSGNELTTLPAEDLEEISSLKVLHVNGNKFQTLPAELGKIRKLLVLDVGSNSLKYNISNWPYDWNWNWNLDLKYLNLSGNKRLEIKNNRNDANSVREKSITDFSQLSKLRVLGLMDVTLTIPNVPDQTEDRRVRLSGSLIKSMSYGMADTLGRNEHLSTIDMVIPDFRGIRDELLVGMFDGQALSTGGSKVSKFLHESVEYFVREELNKLRSDESPALALRRAFLNLNKELATTAMQPLDEKSLPGGTGGPRHASTGSSALLGPDDLSSGGTATVAYMTPDKLYVANAGDAMAVLVRTGGDYKVLTKKHDPGSIEELERIRDAGGWVSRNGKLNDVLDTSRAFGYFHLMPAVIAAPDVQEVDLKDQELLIIGSRELWDFVPFQLAVDIARQEKDKSDLMRAAHKLRDLAICYGATNKIMVMILGLGDLRRPKNRTRSISLQELPKARRRGNVAENPGLSRLREEIKAPDGDLAMVFTDIKNSTLLWEICPVAMRPSIKIHNNLMRRQLRNVGGYEVKTEGDAFMVCFQTATSALRWCFTVQNYLLEMEWPNEILESESGQEIRDADGNLIYRGLSVRMGIHWGAPVCEPDPITGRMDYFGPIVNRAARICNEADGGQIAVSQDLVAEVNRCVRAYHQSEDGKLAVEEAFGDVGTAQEVTRELRLLSNDGFEMKELGKRKLKGLENPEVIYLVYPQSLVGRLAARSAQTPVPIRMSINMDELWKLWDISLRLEMLCSSFNTDGSRIQSTDWTAKLRDLPESVTEHIRMPLFEHIVTRIENSMFVLYTRKLLTGGEGNLQGGAIEDLLGAVQSQLGSYQFSATAVPESLNNTDFSRANSLLSLSPSISPTTATPSRHSRQISNRGTNERHEP